MVGKAVKHGVDHQLDLSEMSLQTLQGYSDKIDQDVFDVLTLEGSVAARNHPGGTAPEQVKKAAIAAREKLEL